MANPITWQNVTGPSLGEAAAPMLAAQRSFDNAFGRVRDDLNKREATEASNYTLGKSNNTDAALAAIRQFKTPQALQEAQDSGQIDALMSRYNGQVDRRVLDQAMDLRPGVLQERVQQENRFADETLQRDQRPLLDAFQSAVASGETAKAQGMLDNTTFFNEGPMAKYLTDATRARTVAEQQDATNAHAVALRPGQLSLQQAQTRGAVADAAEKEGSNTGAGIVGNSHRAFMQAGTDRSNGLMKLAADLKLPVNKAGYPDYDLMDGMQATALDKALKERGLDKPAENSTTAANAAKENLRKAELPPKQLLEAIAQVDKLFANPGLSPEDASQLKGLTDNFDATEKTRRDNNPFYNTGKEQVEQQSSVYNAIRGGVKGDGDFFTVGPLLEEARKLMTEGIKVGGGMRKVPPRLLQSVIAETMQSDTVFFNNTLTNALPILKKYMESKEGQQMFDDAQQYRSGNDKVQRKKLVDDYKAGTNTANPNTWQEGYYKRRQQDIKNQPE